MNTKYLLYSNVWGFFWKQWILLHVDTTLMMKNTGEVSTVQLGKDFLFTTFVTIFTNKFQFQIFYWMIFSFAFKYCIED